jgi:hypothetical protein
LGRKRSLLATCFSLFIAVTGLTVEDFYLLVSLKVFNTEQMNQAVFAFRRYEDASLRHANISTTMNIYTKLLRQPSGRHKAEWSMFFWIVRGMSQKVLERAQHEN